MEYKVKRNKSTTEIIHVLKKSDQINLFEMNLIQNNNIDHLIPIIFNNGLFQKKLIYRFNNCVCIEDYLKQYISFDNFLNVIFEIIDTMQICQNMQLRYNHLEMDSQLIFYDLSTKKIKLIFWPLTKLDNYWNIKDVFLKLSNCYQCDLKSRSCADMDEFCKLIYSLDTSDINEIRYAISKTFGLLEEEETEILEEIKEDDLDATVGIWSDALLRVSNKERITISHLPFVIGRSKECDYVINDNNRIGRKHAVLKKIDGSYYIYDNNSTNRTAVNNEYIQPEENTMVKSGDRIRFADEEFILLI